MIDYQGLFHTGVRVHDLERSMAELGPTLDATWAKVVQRQQPVWRPGRGVETFPLRFTYSSAGPQHVELLECVPGSPWYAGDGPGVHHVGLWVDDVEAETLAAVAAGWDVVAAAAAPDDGFGGFTYIAPPTGMIVELVDARVRPRFEAWWAGGEL